MDLGAATWPQVEATAGRALLAVPLGSLEQHGPHLPLDTDARIAAAVADGLARARPGIAVAPPLPYGASGEHAGVPGTLLVGHEVLSDVLVELVRSARGSFAGVVLVAAHGGNRDALGMAEKRARPRATTCWRGRWPPPAPTRTPAGPRRPSCWPSTLTSVRLERAEPGCTEPLPTLMPRLRQEGLRPVSPNGVLGDPTGPTPARAAPCWARWWRSSPTPWPRRLAADGREPGGRRHRGGPRHRRGDRRPLVGAGWQVVALDRCADDPALDYHLARRPTSTR